MFFKKDGNVMAMVKCLDESTVKQMSVLTTQWKEGKDSYMVVDVDSFVSHCLVITSSRDGKTYLQIKPPELWADLFHEDN